MEQHRARFRWQPFFYAAAAGLAAYLLRDVLLALAVQLGAAGLLMLLCLPLCRALERRLPASGAAAASLLALIAGAGGVVVVLLPPLLRQLGQLAEALPSVMAWVQARYSELQAWMAARGMSLTSVLDGMIPQIGQKAGALLSSLAGMATGAVQSLGKVLLAPLLAFYLLRDRAQFSLWLTMVIPVQHRARAVRAAREMRRETAGFLRGQLLLSLAVGAMTALALLLTGTPGWLLLGALMGVLELVPYIGPFLAGIPAVLLALQGGWMRALWTLAALLIVQQVESTFLSPRLLSGATQLHPLIVLLAVSAGGMLGGAWGMMLVIPAVVSVRGALRGWRR